MILKCDKMFFGFVSGVDLPSNKSITKCETTDSLLGSQGNSNSLIKENCDSYVPKSTVRRMQKT